MTNPRHAAASILGITLVVACRGEPEASRPAPAASSPTPAPSSEPTTTPPPGPLIGTQFGAISPARSLDGELDFDDSDLTLLRWWTNTCPHCEASLPALAELDRRIDGLRVIGVYHPKPPRPVADTSIRKAAADRSFGGAEFGGQLAHDPRWGLLRALQDRGLPRRATSVSVLVDRTGTIRWVHPGPRIHPDPDGRHPAAERGLRELEQIVGALLSDARASESK